MSHETASTTSSLPRSFIVPCGGGVTTVCVNDIAQLRSLRTELELLRRVKSLCDAQSLIPRTEEALHFSDPKQLEFLNILADAMNPLVEQTISVVDQDFKDVRKEIAMSVISEEANSIVEESQKAGVTATMSIPTQTTEPSAITNAPDQSVEQALAAAEQKLSEISGTVDELTNIDAQLLDEAVSQASVVADRIDNDPAAAIDAAAQELATLLSSSESAMSGSPAEVGMQGTSTPVAASHACDESGNRCDSVSRTGAIPGHTTQMPGSSMLSPSHQTTRAYSVGSVACPPTASFPLQSDQFGVYGGNPSGDSSMSTRDHLAVSPERTDIAVAAIENGIRKLTVIMQAEVREQWNLARTVIQEIVASRNTAQQAMREAKTCLSEIRQIHDSASAARDAAGVDQREASVYREDARRAKERAESAATIAETAAEHAAREHESLRRERASRTAR